MRVCVVSQPVSSDAYAARRTPSILDSKGGFISLTIIPRAHAESIIPQPLSSGELTCSVAGVLIHARLPVTCERMEDRFGHRISYLRVSITDRCNERCA